MSFKNNFQIFHNYMVNDWHLQPSKTKDNKTMFYKHPDYDETIHYFIFEDGFSVNSSYCCFSYSKKFDRLLFSHGNENDFNNLIVDLKMKTQDSPARKYYEQIEKARQLFGKEIGEGRERIVFNYDEENVIKIPLHPQGAESNIGELSYYQKFKNPKVAVTKSVPSKEFFFAVLQEKVSSLSDDEIPEWSELIDVCQIGKNKNNEIVAYDFPEIAIPSLEQNIDFLSEEEIKTFFKI